MIESTERVRKEEIAVFLAEREVYIKKHSRKINAVLHTMNSILGLLFTSKKVDNQGAKLQ